MRRKWLLFSFCLSVLLTLAPLSRAGLTLRVNEAATRVLFEHQSAEVALALENLFGKAVKQHVLIELIDPQNHIRATADRVELIDRGTQTLHLVLPFDISKLPEKDRRQLLWYRLHYLISNNQAPLGVTAEGIISLSEITPDLFEVRVAAAEMAHEAMRYRARVQAIHPITKKPAEGVRIEAILTLETDDTGSGVKLSAAGITDAKGYSILFFDLPARFPEFPHELRPAGGSIKLTARRGGFTTELENQILVDQFPRMLLSTDKPIYQPGQHLHMRALALSPTKHALANQDVIFRIDDPENTNVFRDTVKSSRFGVASVDWLIPENARLGDYWLKVALGAGEDSGQTSVKVRISRYDLPNFSVKVQPNQTYYLPGQNAEVKVSADYLFGQPVTHGHVRVVREVEREWNYKEQKWDIEEGDKYEGETDATGAFIARVELADDHDDLGDEDYRRFKDITYAAYFTDPTTNRTEQRRFDLRITKNPIHVYVIRNDNSYRENSKLPLEFYVSTFYADGLPAQCRISISLKNDSERKPNQRQQAKRLVTLTSNRYGLARVSGLRLPSALQDDDVELEIAARDSHGKDGFRKEEFTLDEDTNEVRVETDKSLYRAGEPIVASIISSVPNQVVVVDVGRDAVVLNSQIVRLFGGRSSVEIPYKPEFKDRPTIAAYADFANTSGMISARTILYPRNHDLKIDAQLLAKSYRPGDEAEISFRVRGSGGRTASTLGLAIVDKAVDERFRTDGEFGNRSYGFYGSIRQVLGDDDQIAGVTLRDLEHVDTSKPVSADLELVAEILLNQSQNYRPSFFGGDSYDFEQQKVFSDLTKSQLAQAKYTLTAHYAKTGDYPNNEVQLRSLLSQAGIDLQAVHDPWGNPYRPMFSIDKQSDVLSFRSAGADKRFGTDDDFSIESNRWAYFRPFGEAIDRTVREYHVRTGGFIRDIAALRAEAANQGLNLDTLRDRWNQPYRIKFDVDQSSYVIKVSSSGPDKKFEEDQYYIGDEFYIWASQIDYFAEARVEIEAILTQQLKNQNRFPQNERELSASLRDAKASLESLRDPWGRPYYSTFKVQPYYTDRIQNENRARFGESPIQQTQVTPVTAKATVINLRSMGADGRIGIPDDFDVATFAGVLTEQTGSDSKPSVVSSPVVFSGTNGAIAGSITDPNGAAITGVTITATRSSDSQSYSTSSDDDGKYIFANLLPGLYELRFEARGFTSTVITNVLVRSSNIVEVSVALQLGATTETVTVTGSAPSLQTQASNSVVLELPARGRQLTQLRGVNIVTKSGGAQQSSTPRLREYLPETLVWQPALETDKQGRAQLKFKLADNITTWKMSVIGSTEDGQIGTVEKEIKAFQPFFVEHDPPRVLTEGDEISVPVVVRNYLDSAQTVRLEIKPESWFAVLGPAAKSVNVAAGDATRGIFDFRANAAVKDGKQRITATGADANDAIEKPVTVHPDGEEKAVTASDVISDSAALTLDIPQTALPNSTRAELKIYPNLMAHVAESVEAIMARPYGCGEQTISSTYPSLLYLRHYKRMGPPATPTGRGSDSRARAERYLRAGYNRLLNYRNESGGFTYWGSGEPDLALTAYALRFLSEARELIAVDEDPIKEARAWLVKQQRADGSWAAHDYGDKVENKPRTALLTAFVARVLAMTEAKNEVAASAKPSASAPKPADSSLALKRALDYLSLRTEEIDEPYLIASYSLAALEASDT